MRAIYLIYQNIPKSRGCGVGVYCVYAYVWDYGCNVAFYNFEDERKCRDVVAVKRRVSILRASRCPSRYGLPIIYPFHDNHKNLQS